MATKFPQGTNEFYEILGLNQQSVDIASVLPIQSLDSTKEAAVLTQKSGESNKSGIITPNVKSIEHDMTTNTYTVNVSKIFSMKGILGFVPYFILFIVCVFFYMILFTNFQIQSLFSFLPKQTQTAEAATTVSNGDELRSPAYNAWIAQYFYDVTDPSITNPNNDISGNGLTNYQKFLLGLNPTKKDTLGLGQTDTAELMEGINPLTNSPMTQAQKDFVNVNIDLEAISNKLSLQTADATTAKSTGSEATLLAANRSTTTINQSTNAEVDIPTLNLKVPLFWTQNVNDFESELPNGLVHYPGTAMPGEIGTAYISGHSSNYAWIKGNYNKVFANLDKLKQYDSFSIVVTDSTGKKVTYHYVVTGCGIYTADDQSQFASTGKSVVALSTCWPVGTSAKRLVVFGELTQVEQ